jgi:molybdopterin-synthase adenylyltransferase
MKDLKFLHENLYKDISGITDKQIVILGCGAIGANLAISLARRGFHLFTLVDFDKIDEHNLSTQPWSMQDLGRTKVYTLSTMLYSMTRARASALMGKMTNTKHAFNSDLFIDCFDNHDSRKVAQDLFTITHMPVLHVGMSNQNTGEVTWDIRYVIPPEVKLADPCNYPMSRTLVDLTVVAASEAIINFLTEDKKHDYLINANTLGIKQLV